MSKTAEAWARIREIQEGIGHKPIGIMMGQLTARELFGSEFDNYEMFGGISGVVTQMGEVTIYLNEDLDPDELIVL